MLPSARASSISTSAGAAGARGTRSLAGRRRLAVDLAAVVASFRAMAGERLYHLGLGGGFAIYLILPISQIAIFAIIYGAASDLFAYLVVAQAAGAFMMVSVYYNGEILDRERAKGTLVALFLAPCSRFAWLTGFVLAGLVETGLIMGSSLAFGRLAYGVTFDPNLPALGLAVALFLAALWGLGLVFAGIGLILKRSNAFSNLVWPFIVLLGGLYFPVSELPDGLRHVAAALPFGYGLRAIADAALHDASVADIAGDLLPLAGFALALPLAGIAVFNWLDRVVRVRGELDVY